MIVTTYDTGREAIERLRSRVPQRDTPVQLDQALTLCQLLGEGWHSLDAVSAQTGLSRSDVVATVVELGTWLGQSVNAGAKIPAIEFQRAVGDERTMGDSGQQSLFPSHTERAVVIPPGFERSAAGRDLSKAIAQIVCAAPDEGLLRRWLMRKYHRIRQVLGFEMVTLVHRICQIGRLGEIDQLAELGKFNHELARVLVEAYDLLDVARADAVGAVGRITALEGADDIDPAQLDRDMTEAAWLHEGEFVRLRRGTDAVSAALRDQALAEFRLAVRRAPAVYLPQGVCHLSDGQVLRLASREGLATSSGGQADSDRVRGWVVEAGMGSDADLLVADGVRAERAGLGPMFREALARRSEGDLDWSVELNDALAQVARV